MEINRTSSQFEMLPSPFSTFFTLYNSQSCVSLLMSIRLPWMMFSHWRSLSSACDGELQWRSMTFNFLVHIQVRIFRAGIDDDDVSDLLDNERDDSTRNYRQTSLGDDLCDKKNANPRLAPRNLTSRCCIVDDTIATGLWFVGFCFFHIFWKTQTIWEAKQERARVVWEIKCALGAHICGGEKEKSFSCNNKSAARRHRIP